ncbi:glycosyltransferase family 2 protein [Microbacterium sp. CPCC 204701]|uniref:glycosyltransferase family 2 protein n=1 Tax=Microbacterium sp. CPCC 204701 TaxID=2493084 RepID=UPI0013E30550|nr:glycosyltransferase family A protein [Microbacterium sp. CPCC 204701]
MTQDPVVSVVIATNRDSPFLAEAIASVVAQTYSPWELIVVDNGVPDPAPLHRLVAAIPRSRVVHVPPPVTVSLARNAGVAASEGALVVFLDDDDVWHPERLERQVRALAAKPEAPASYCGGWHLDAEGRTIEPAWPAAPATAAEMLSRRKRMPHICGAMMIRRLAFAESGGFSPELTMMEDFELALRLLQRGDFACVPDALVGYRRHDRNATGTGLENARVRRDALDGILSRHRWAARVRGDALTARLLEEHLVRERRRAAAEAAAAALWSARRLRLGDVVRECVWGMRRSPAGFGWGLIERLVRR